MILIYRNVYIDFLLNNINIEFQYNLYFIVPSFPANYTSIYSINVFINYLQNIIWTDWSYKMIQKHYLSKFEGLFHKEYTKSSDIYNSVYFGQFEKYFINKIFIVLLFSTMSPFKAFIHVFFLQNSQQKILQYHRSIGILTIPLFILLYEEGNF